MSRRERDAAQAAAEAQSSRAAAEAQRLRREAESLAQRQTVRPVSPAPADRPNPNADRGSRTATAIDALSRLLQQRQEREEEQEQQEQQERQRQQALVRQSEAQRQAEAAKAARERIASQIKENNERAKSLFDQAREVFSWGDVVEKIQDYAWDRLNVQLEEIPRQVQLLSLEVDAIISNVPPSTKVIEAVRGYPQRKLVDYLPNIPLVVYKGPVNKAGRPEGQGMITFDDRDGNRTTWTVEFRDGKPMGTGTVKTDWKDGGTSQWIGQMDALGPSGVGTMINERRSEGGKSVFKGKVTREGTGVGSFDNVAGQTYTGPVQNFRPSGVGVWAASPPVVGWNENGKLMYGQTTDGNGVRVQCDEYASNMECKGVRKTIFATGGVVVRSRDRKTIVQEGRTDGGATGYVMYRRLVDGDSGMAQGFIQWTNGDRYEGEFRNGSWADNTVGRLVKLTGVVQAGRFRDQKLVDGWSTAIDGTKIQTGDGTEYALALFTKPPSTTPSRASTSGAEDAFLRSLHAIDSAGYVTLDGVLERLKRQSASIEVLIVIGHTDSRLNESDAESISRRRGESVKDYLVHKGVEPQRIFVEPKGATQPLASNSTPQGRAKNNRVELEVVAVGPAKAKIVFGETVAVQSQNASTADSGYIYFSQLAVFRQKELATDMQDRLKAKGTSASITEAASPDNQKVYRLRIGPFETVDAAKAATEKMNMAGFQPTVVRVAP